MIRYNGGFYPNDEELMIRQRCINYCRMYLDRLPTWIEKAELLNAEEKEREEKDRIVHTFIYHFNIYYQTCYGIQCRKKKIQHSYSVYTL